MGKILIQEKRARGLTGIVEQANGCVYLYAYEGGSYGILGACWICNTKRAPKYFNQQQIEKGLSPRMPAMFCGHPKKGIKIDPKNLKVQWSQDSNILVLKEKDIVLGVIVDVTKKVSTAYSRYASGDTPYAHTLESLSPELRTFLGIQLPVPPYVDLVKAEKEQKKREKIEARNHAKPSPNDSNASESGDLELNSKDGSAATSEPSQQKISGKAEKEQRKREKNEARKNAKLSPKNDSTITSESNETELDIKNVSNTTSEQGQSELSNIDNAAASELNKSKPSDKDDVTVSVSNESDK